MNHWSTKVYGKFQQERTQPSVDLVNRICARKKDCRRILDIGCGSGMSTLPLRMNFPDAEIIGVDKSEEMLRDAQELLDDVKWTVRDCSKPLDDLGTFDLVFSNAFIQWIQNQEEFIRNTRNLLADGGLFGIQVPAYEETDISRIIKETAAEYDVSGNLFQEAAENSCVNYSIETYYDIFSRYYSFVDIWQTDYFHQVDDYAAIAEFARGAALLPYFAYMDSSQTKEFMELLTHNIRKHYSAAENGKILFRFKRFFIMAEK